MLQRPSTQSMNTIYHFFSSVCMCNFLKKIVVSYILSLCNFVILVCKKTKFLNNDFIKENKYMKLMKNIKKFST